MAQTPTTAQEYYRQTLRPQEQQYAQQQLAQFQRARQNQGAASIATNMDLSRRLGLSQGYAQDASQALDTSLGRDMAQAMEQRRLGLQQQIEQRRKQKIMEHLASQQKVVDDVSNTVGGVGGLLGAGATLVGGIIGGPWGAALQVGGAATSALSNLLPKAAIADNAQYGTSGNTTIKDGFRLPTYNSGLPASPSDSFNPQGGLSANLGNLYRDPNDPSNTGGI